MRDFEGAVAALADFGVPLDEAVDCIDDYLVAVGELGLLEGVIVSIDSDRSIGSVINVLRSSANATADLATMASVLRDTMALTLKLRVETVSALERERSIATLDSTGAPFLVRY